MSVELQELDSIIIGIGINTNVVAAEIKNFATSIQEETGMCGIRNQLIAEILNQFELVYFDYTKQNKKQDIMQYYQSRLFIIGNEITVTEQGNAFLATVKGVDEDGGLIVENVNGEIQTITTGEIQLHPVKQK